LRLGQLILLVEESLHQLFFLVAIRQNLADRLLRLLCFLFLLLVLFRAEDPIAQPSISLFTKDPATCYTRSTSDWSRQAKTRRYSSRANCSTSSSTEQPTADPEVKTPPAGKRRSLLQLLSKLGIKYFCTLDQVPRLSRNQLVFLTES
jgi:hypothetical protein